MITANIAITVHIYYPQLWDEIATYLIDIDTPFDLFITVSPENAKQVTRMVQVLFPKAVIKTLPNRGMDIVPFLTLIPELVEADYQMVCKLHTKKGDGKLGSVWREALLQSLVGSNKTIQRVSEAFRADNNLAMVGTGAFYLSARKVRQTDSTVSLQQLCDALAIPLPSHDWGFFAGSMFWVRPKTLMPLALVISKYPQWFSDKTQSDGVVENVLECVVGLISLQSQKTTGHLLSIIGNKQDFVLQKMEVNQTQELIGNTDVLSLLSQYETLVKDRTLLLKTGLFSYSDYLAQFPWLSGLQVDLLSHYLLVGRFQGGTPYLDLSKASDDQTYYQKDGVIIEDPEALSKVASQEIEQGNALEALREKIIESKLFDKEWYIKNYQNTYQIGDPLDHYLEHWTNLELNPSKKFDAKYYLETHSDVAASGENPLVHYVLYGREEGRSIQQIDETFGSVDAVYGWFNTNAWETRLPIPNLVVDIVIPVYNGKQYLTPLFESIRKNTSHPYRLLVIDDHSPDPEVSVMLRQEKKNFSDNQFLLIENKKNLGFVKSVNKAVLLAQNHFVLLNTDVEVPPWWLERLMSPIFQLDNVASTTPFTNAATIFSFPEYCVDNPIFQNLSVDAVDSYFSTISFDKTYIEVPTTVGFCMGINKNVVDKIGMFDEVFGKGYGEENDWCQRAKNMGYSNIHVTNLFVYHKHGGSFESKEKKQLLKKNSQILNVKHPKYFRDVSRVVSENELESLRGIVKLKILSSLHKPTLIIDHTLGGGANEFTKEVLLKDPINFILIYNHHKHTFFIKCVDERNELLSQLHLNKYSDLVLFLQLFNVDEIIVNELVTYPDVFTLIRALCDIKKNQPKIRMIFMTHDFYAVCPSVNLIDAEINYCGVPDNFTTCNKCLGINSFNQTRFYKDEIKIQQWRKEFSALLESCDQIQCFSGNSRKILKKAFEIPDQKIKIRPHRVDWVKSLPIPAPNDVLNLAVVGHLTPNKGLFKLIHLVTFVLAKDIKIKFHLFGKLADANKSLQFMSNVTCYGEYDKAELPRLITDSNIHAALILSIWPETFSYTTSEIIEMGIPVGSFDMGAQGDKVNAYDKGIIFPNDNPSVMCQSIFRYFDKPFIYPKSKSPEKIKIACVSNDNLMYERCISSSYFLSAHSVTKFNNLEVNLPIPERYNTFIDENIKTNEEGWLFFIHNDFSIFQDLNYLVEKLDKNAIYGPIGARLVNEKKRLYGEILEQRNNNLTKHGGQIDKPTLVDTVDCQCIFFHTSLLKKYHLRFDENKLFAFHQYTEDFCLSAFRKHKIETYAVPMFCMHLSTGTLNNDYYQVEKYLKQKYGVNWAGTCTHVD